MQVFRTKTLKMTNYFFKKTHYFWVVSRFILILLFAYASINQLNEKSLSSIIVACLFLFVAIWMLSIAILEIRNKKFLMPVKVLTGSFSVFFGLLLSYLIISLGGENYSLWTNLGFLIIPLWIITYGIWEIKTAK